MQCSSSATSVARARLLGSSMPSAVVPARRLSRLLRVIIRRMVALSKQLCAATAVRASAVKQARPQYAFRIDVVIVGAV